MAHSRTNWPVLLSVCALALGMAAVPAAGQQSSGSDAAGQLPAAAEAVLMIVHDPTTSGLDQRAVESLLRNWVPDVEGLSAGAKYAFRYTRLEAGEGTSMGLLEFVKLSGCRDVDAEKILELARKELQKALMQIHSLAKLSPLMLQIKLAEERVASAAMMVSRQTDRLRKSDVAAHSMGVPSLDAANGDLLATVQREKLTLGAELIGLEAQREAILKQIEQRRAELVAGKPEETAGLEDLEHIVKIREEQLQGARAMAKHATLPHSELLEAELKLSTARAELAQRRAMIAEKGGSRIIDQLNEQLGDVQVRIAAITARVEATEKNLAELASTDVRLLVIEYGQARQALDSAVAEREAAQAELARLHRARDALAEPEIIVISKGKPSPDQSPAP
jgi:hypothetical protein